MRVAQVIAFVTGPSTTSTPGEVRAVMAEATCGTCSGTGGAYTTEFGESGRPTGGQVWEPCPACGGTGIVWAPDEEPTPSPEQPSASRRQRPPRGRPAKVTSERLDRSFRTLLTLLFAGLLGWLAFLTPILKDVNRWVLLGVCVALAGLFFWGLTRIPRAIRVLRISFAWFLVLGLALAFAVAIYFALS